MNYTRMTRGNAYAPQRFWERILVTKEEVDLYEKIGYVNSNCSMYDFQFDLKPTDKIIN